jgi:leucyl-tRNA synthetase
MKIFTTRIDTLMGVSYCVIAPEHNLVEHITTNEHKKSVNNYIKVAGLKTEIERLAEDDDKTGVFTGSYAIHPITGEHLPIWIADYVLDSYGTGCVMAVPAHDERDFVFAQKYNLPIKQVVICETCDETILPYTLKEGRLINSGEFNGLTVAEGKCKIAETLSDKTEFKVNYRLRDWLVSRQRYWGAPIPIIYCPECGTVPVNEVNLPVILPYDVEFLPTGESPLKKCTSFMNTICPKCGKNAQRDPDTLDTFVCSSWYFLRYPDSHNNKEAFNSELINKMLPVDKYIGGPEHAVMHLLYARFITKVLRDIGKLNFDEPFLSLVHQGLILGPDGSKMSKSKGNTVSPDEYIKKHGSDVFRLHLMFAFSYTDGGPWSDEGIKAILRFISRIENSVKNIAGNKFSIFTENLTPAEEKLNYKLHLTIKGVTDDAQRFHFNTVIAKLMELLNEVCNYENLETPKNIKIYTETVKTFIKLLAPFAPHFAEEMWEKLNGKESIFKSEWPKCKNILKKEVEIVVQINGKVRHKVTLSNGLDSETLKQKIMEEEKIKYLLKNKSIEKIFVVPNKLVSIVTK